MYTKTQEFMAELIGTMFILLFGAGVDSVVTLFNLGAYANITFGWGAGVFFGILVSNRISGAHLNPAVSLALAITKRFPFSKLPHYVIGQMIGGFCGAAIVYYFFHAKFAMVDPTLSHTAGIFTTFAFAPEFWPSFMSELIATAILLYAILAIVEYFNNEKAGWLAPFAIAILIVAIGMCFGGMHGYAMNVARDVSPRLFVALAGFQNTGFTYAYDWCAVFGSLIGGPLGAILYNLTIGKKPTLFQVDKGVAN